MAEDDLSLQSRGSVLFEALAPAGSTEGVRALALEAARIADRLDELDRIIAGQGVLNLMRFRLTSLDFDDPEATVEVKFDSVLSEARQQAATLRQILHTLGVSGASASAPAAPKQKGSPLDELNARRAARRAGATGR